METKGLDIRGDRELPWHHPTLSLGQGCCGRFRANPRKQLITERLTKLQNFAQEAAGPIHRDPSSLRGLLLLRLCTPGVSPLEGCSHWPDPRQIILGSQYQPWVARAAPRRCESAGIRPSRLAAGRTVASLQELSPTSSLVGRDSPISASFKILARSHRFPALVQAAD